MFTPKHIAAAAVCALTACASQPMSSGKGPALGAPMSAEEIARYDISIPPSGAGLPPGSGSVKQGEAVYTTKCLACHGEKGIGKPADRLVGGTGSLATKAPLRTVGSADPESAVADQ